ncbi:hypothetical protein GCM10010124_37020 [Pilimelia terevasa]|uniref:ATP-binding protein n=1 Tax=Pilimelia terevasa TaxID=53372 RepID=A0A8J3FKJ6_9ACTN|nr:hypothetical protein [Pilimelia terevasa]GGK40770.1 hypothetical protein GCM10010124_37020 [Pilimelia terevasa]
MTAPVGAAASAPPVTAASPIGAASSSPGPAAAAGPPPGSTTPGGAGGDQSGSDRTDQPAGGAGPDGQGQADDDAGGDGPGETTTGEAAGDSTHGVTEASATEQPGRASQRHEYLRAAERNYGGDAVAGDKFVYYLTGTAATEKLRPFPASHQDLVRHAFVPPVSWDDYRNEFRGRRAVVLRGRPGHGRDAMAIRLLQTVEARAVYLLDPRADLSRLAELLSAQGIEKGAGFLIQEPIDIAQLDRYTFENLESALVEADARLVVIVGSDVSLSHDDLLRHQMDLPEAPNRRDILNRHLGYHLDDEPRAQQILARAAVEELVAEHLNGAEATCEITSVLALHLSRAAEPIDTAAVRAHLRRRHADTFDIWFDSLQDLELRCFAIALATLHGLPYEDVAEAARRLHDRLSDGGALTVSAEGQLTVRRGDPFRLRATSLLRRLRASTLPAQPGQLPTTAVAYRDDGVAGQVIYRAWHGYCIHDQLLQWLGDLAAEGSAEVSTYASRTLGEFSTYAFDYVRDHALVPWVNSGVARRQQAVADALAVAAKIPALHGSVVQLVNGWYAARTQPRAQFTAALAQGTGLDRPDPRTSLAALERLAMVDSFLVRLGIARGMTELMAGDPDRLAQAVYESIWRCLGDPRRTAAGHLAFVVVANDLVTERTVGQHVTVWPTLLRLAVEHRHLQQPLSMLWARTLTEGQVNRVAEAVLRVWAGYAESDPGIQEAFVRMARGIGRMDGRAGATLERLARLWNGDEELLPLPLVASRVSAVLTSAAAESGRHTEELA